MIKLIINCPLRFGKLDTDTDAWLTNYENKRHDLHFVSLLEQVFKIWKKLYNLSLYFSNYLVHSKVETFLMFGRFWK